MIYRGRYIKIRNCKECGKAISFTESARGTIDGGVNKYLRRKFCSKECNQKFSSYTSELKGIAPGSVGAIGELIVCIDLLSKGYDVYRAVSPSSACDVLVVKNRKVYCIEVRTGHYYKTTKGIDKSRMLAPTGHNVRARNMAIVIHKEKKVIYIQHEKAKSVSSIKQENYDPEKILTCES